MPEFMIPSCTDMKALQLYCSCILHTTDLMGIAAPEKMDGGEMTGWIYKSGIDIESVRG